MEYRIAVSYDTKICRFSMLYYNQIAVCIRQTDRFQIVAGTYYLKR